MYCPNCESERIIKNGFNSARSQMYRCKECNYQFVLNPQKSRIPNAKKTLIKKLLLERVSLAGIARVTGVSMTWLQQFVNEFYRQIPRTVDVSKKEKGRLTVECDEMWSFVEKKQNKQWVWLAQDQQTKEIVGAYIGDRSEASAKKLWDSLPPVYRQCAVCYTDFWKAYANVLPKKRHRAVGKETGRTNGIERFNNTCRQRISRLVRKTLSFSKKLDNHIGAIWYFIHHYNASLNKNYFYDSL